MSKLNEDPWLGIEVWGTSGESQFDEEFFGIMELKNGAEISYADNAVSLWKSGDYSNTGGIILSSESYFYNNRRSVEFVTFQNTTQGGAHHKNLSEFHLTQFLVDDGYIDTGGNPFYSHVTLWDVDGVEFKGCGFINYQSNLNSSLFHNNGIKSIDASYHVKEDDISYADVSSFIGHNFGIIATGTGFNSSVFVHSAAFKGNFCGFLADNVKNFEFINSNLILGGFPLFTTFNQVGVVSNESTGYQISGNLFERGNQTTASTFGTHIVNSGEDNNFVFNNKFDNLTIGSNSAGINKSSNTFAIWDGLRYICNKYYNSSQSDLSISTFNSNPTYDGISSIQGDINSPASAGNIFTQPGVNPNGHINNLTTNAIRYVHHGGTSEPIFYTNSNVFLYNYSANSCEESPYFFGEEEFELNNSVELISSEEIMENLSLLYNSLIDNGNTDAIIYNIEHNWNDSGVLLSNLLLISPFLSFDAFSASVRKNLLNPNQVLELCVSNPELTYHPEFYNLLEEYHYTTINFLSQLVNENNNFISERGLLEWNILNAKSKLKMSTDQMITKELKKESINIDFIRSILQNRQSLSDLYMLAESYYLHSKDFINGELILLNIPHEKVLAAHQLADYHEYMKFFAFQKRINEQSRYISQLEPNEILELEQFSNSSSTRVSSRAKNILCFFYEICETYNFGVNSLQANSRLDSKIIQHMKEEIEVKVFPNPASNYALINWSTEVESFNGTITIKDLSAKTVSITSIKSSKGVWQWDTTEIQNGFYIYEFSNDNRVLSYGKIVIQK